LISYSIFFARSTIAARWTQGQVLKLHSMNLIVILPPVIQ